MRVRKARRLGRGRVRPVTEVRFAPMFSTQRVSSLPKGSFSHGLQALLLLLLVSTFAQSARAATRTVAAGASLQQALDAAQPGDTLVLVEGASFVGFFMLPRKQDECCITIQ